GHADPNAAARSASDPYSPLTLAVRNDSADIVAALVDAGAKVDAVDSSGNWPMREAVRDGFVDQVGLLLKNGANPNLRDASGRTLLHFIQEPASYFVWFKRFARTIGQRHFDCIKALKLAGFDFNAKDNTGLSVLGAAVKRDAASTDLLDVLVS